MARKERTMRTQIRAVLALFIVLLVVMAFAPPSMAQQIKETQLFGYNGSVWEGIDKGTLLGSRMVYQDDFLGYCNTTTGVAVLAGASAPDNSNILTPVDWYWGTTLTSGTVKLLNNVNGTMVLDTGHVAQNDMASVTWREQQWDISNNPTMEAYVKLNNLTNCWFEVGYYVDANDECLFRFKASVSSTKWLCVYENNNGGEVSYTTTTSAAANTYTRLKLELLSTGGARFWINGILVKTLAASAIRDVAIKPFFYAVVTDAGHAATKTMTVDYVRLTQDR
jgi:hypothetical protein